MKKILLITTGGTIACVASDNGLKPGQDGKSILAGIEDKACKIDICDLLSLDSTNIGPKEWIKIATAVYQKMDDYDGIVISHGTDTMAYTAAALYYMFPNPLKPVVLTGSQLPMGEPGGDAEGNLQSAITVAMENTAGIFVCFAGRIIFGDCAKKTHSKEFAAFESIGRDYAGSVQDGRVTWNRSDSQSDDCKEENNARMLVNITQMHFDEKVCCIKLLPGMDGAIIDAMVSLGYHGIILEAFGSGNVPNLNGNLFESIKKAITKGVQIAIISQCTYDGTDLSIYEMGKQALELQVVDAKKMTVEALSVKMMYKLGMLNGNEN